MVFNMGCKLSVSVVHPESVLKTLKERMSPNFTKKSSKPKIEDEKNVKKVKKRPPDSPDSIDIYKTIYLDEDSPTL